MNRREFLDCATKSLACTGVAMLLTGKGLKSTELDEPEQRSVQSISTEEYEFCLWHATKEHGDHSWDELRETVRRPGGEYYTRPFGDDGVFFRTDVTPKCYPTHRYLFKDDLRKARKSPNWA